MVFQFFLSFVEQHVGVLYFLLYLESSHFPTKRLLGQLPWVEASDGCVVELIPFSILSPLLDERIIVATISIADMNGNSLQDIIVVGVGEDVLFVKLVRVLLLS